MKAVSHLSHPKAILDVPSLWHSCPPSYRIWQWDLVVYASWGDGESTFGFCKFTGCPENNSNLACYGIMLGRVLSLIQQKVTMVKHQLRFCSALRQYLITPATHNYVWAHPEMCRAKIKFPPSQNWNWIVFLLWPLLLWSFCTVIKHYVMPTTCPLSHAIH